MSKANILVVDDQDSIRHFVCQALEAEGYTVVSAGTVREARAAIERDMPDMAFLKQFLSAFDPHRFGLQFGQPRFLFARQHKIAAELANQCVL